jgi:hypothetical protein
VIGPLLIAALSIWALGSFVDLARSTNSVWARACPYVAGIIGSGVVTAAGAIAVYRPQAAVSLGATLGVGDTSVRVEPRSPPAFSVGHGPRTGAVGAAPVPATCFSSGRSP